MAYTKNTWADGDVVTSEKLNHMEDGIANSGGGVMVINDTDNTLDKTWQEIYDAMAANTFCVIKYVSQGIGGSGMINYLVTKATNDEIAGTYRISALFEHNADRIYSTTSATGYPTGSEFN